MHINGLDECRGCQAKLIGCDARISQLVALIRKEFPDCHVAVGYRDQLDQQKAFGQGLSKLQWPESKHNVCDYFNNPESLAVDVFRLGDDNKAYFEPSYFEKIWSWMELHPDLKGKYIWGGVWITFKDRDHFEVVT